MQTNNSILKIVLTIIILVVLIFIVSMFLKPEDQYSTQKQAGQSDDASAYITTVSSTTTVESDMDSYIKATGNTPDSNEFNDSYSDLNQ